MAVDSAGRSAGSAVRALAWLGRERAHEARRRCQADCPRVTCRNSSAHAPANLDGARGQRTRGSWLNNSCVYRLATAREHWRSQLPPAARFTSWRRTSGSSGPSKSCSIPPSPSTRSSRAGLRCRKRTVSSGDSPKTSISPTTFVRGRDGAAEHIISAVRDSTLPSRYG